MAKGRNTHAEVEQAAELGCGNDLGGAVRVIDQGHFAEIPRCRAA